MPFSPLSCQEPTSSLDVQRSEPVEGLKGDLGGREQKDHSRDVPLIRRGIKCNQNSTSLLPESSPLRIYLTSPGSASIHWADLGPSDVNSQPRGPGVFLSICPPCFLIDLGFRALLTHEPEIISLMLGEGCVFPH